MIYLFLSSLYKHLLVSCCQL